MNALGKKTIAHLRSAASGLDAKRLASLLAIKCENGDFAAHIYRLQELGEVELDQGLLTWRLGRGKYGPWPILLRSVKLGTWGTRDYPHGAPCWFCGEPVLAMSTDGSFICGACAMGVRDKDSEAERARRSRNCARRWQEFKANPPQGNFVVPAFEEKPCCKCGTPSILRRGGWPKSGNPTVLVYCLDCDPFAYTDREGSPCHAPK